MFQKASQWLTVFCTSIPTGAVVVFGCIAFLAIYALSH